MKMVKLNLLIMPVLMANPTFGVDEPTSPIPVDWGLEQVASKKALAITKGRKDVIVAIIDTGIDINHPDLKDHLWVNSNEILNGKDDDGNGLIDDIHGWNFAKNNSKIDDQHGHGTHISGIVSRLAPNVKLMILKYYDPKASGDDNLKNSIAAMEYAVHMKVQIINYSGGGTEKSDAEEKVIKSAERQKTLLIAAAGNEKSNSDKIPFYPANYKLSNILAVTAIDTQSRILASSNWGQNSVDIAAPGFNISSTSPGGGYKTMTGTSQATAFVTGIAALILSTRHGQTSLSSLKRSITQVSNVDKHLLHKTKFGTQANSLNSLKTVDQGIDAFGGYIENLKEINGELLTVP